MSFASAFLDLVYPRLCAGCGAAVGAKPGHVCWDCRTSLDFISHPFCAVCGDPVDGRINHEYTCSWCLEMRPNFDMARSAVRYRGAARTIIHAFKYGGAACLDRDLGPFLCECVKTHYPRTLFNAVTFVPLFRKRERERTYNQAGLLAKTLAADLRLPLLSNCLLRTRATLTQTDLAAPQRRMNVADAFLATNHEWLEGRSLLLVDDVMTTGSTVDECARVLKRAGAVRVCVVTVARG